MLISSALCRAQEAQQRSRAADTDLENVRLVAIDAANAWSIEGVAAERREQRLSRLRLEAAAAAASQVDETPDRD